MDPRIIPITVPLGQLLHPVRLTGALMQGERNAHRFVISACAAADDPTPVPLSGTVTARFMPANGPTVNLTGAVAGGAAVVALAPACYSLPGAFRLTIMVTNGDDTLAACAVTGDILRTTSGVETAGSAMPGYEQVLAVYDDMRAAITRAEAALASVCPAVSTGPANLISVPDAVAIAPDALTLALPLTQDLHGYAAPWPGGAAPGILYSKEVSLTEPEITLPLTLESGTYTLWAQAISTNPDPDAIYEIKAYPSISTGTYQEIDLYTGSAAPSADCGVSTGAVDGIVLEGGITGHEYPPTVRVMVLSGDVALANIPPWENICPITGRTGANVYHAGKNILPNTFTTKTQGGITATAASDGSIHVTGTRTGSNTFLVGSMTLLPGSYILSGSPNGGGSDSNRKWRLRLGVGASSSVVGSAYEGEHAFTVTETDIYAVNIIVDTSDLVDLTFYPMVRSASIADGTYEPYNANTYTFTFPAAAGTVYGGTLDVLTGTLTVNRIKRKFSDFSWAYATSISAFRITRTSANSGIFTQSGGQTPAQACCDSYSVANETSSTVFAELDNVVSIGNSSLSSYSILVKDSQYTEVAAFLAARGDTEIVYTLATPVPYQLTPAQVTMLAGANAIWTDDGALSLTYRVSAYDALLALIRSYHPETSEG